MRLSTRLIIAVTIILLVVILVGIYGTYATFIRLFTELELWGKLLVRLCVCTLAFFVCVGIVLLVWSVITDIQIKRLRLTRFTPSPQGYYEAIHTSQGFRKPSDNIPLQVPYTYSPHITQAKTETEQPQSDDVVVLELYDKGLSLRSIEKATGISYRQVQKITRIKREE